MYQKEVADAFDIVLDEIEKAVTTLNREGAQAFGKGDYEKVDALKEKCSQMTAIRDRVKELRKEWLDIFATVVPQPPRKRRLQRGLRTPENEFRIPILQSLVELGGSANLNVVLDKVEKIMSHKLNDYDRQTLPSDPKVQRWRNSAQWARADMVKEGLLSSVSPRGVWEITDSGRRYLEQHK